MRTNSLGVLALVVGIAAGCGSNGNNADAGAGGSVGTAGSGGSSGGAGGTRPTPDAGAAADGSAMALGPCGVLEPEPNDNRDMATRYSAGMEVTACIANGKDVDFYEFTTPATDMAGGYFLFSITNVGAFTPEVLLYSANDNGMIEQVYADSNGQNLSFYLAGAPGQKYRIAIGAFAQIANTPSRYTFKGTYTKVDDTYEPNDTRETAKPITVGTPIMAYFYAGFTAAKLKVEDYDDWYSVNLAAGMATIKMENVPTDSVPHVWLFDASNKEVAMQIGGNEGANTTATAMNVAAGAYRVRVTAFSVTPRSAGKGAMAPDHFTRPYKLTVTQ